MKIKIQIFITSINPKQGKAKDRTEIKYLF